ncbi:ABC transporter ATP-binding protein/permease [Ruminococcaceae bacterium OttesenSCG-928-A16]|nr:ABC transporter ATP-binding protein/permease [Ruminococcaceae bacterium OttesenSCG-928-A16]
MGYVTPYKKLLFGSFAGAVLSVPLALAGPVFIGRAIDAIVGTGNVNFTGVWQNLLLLGLTAGIAAFLHWVLQVCTRKISVLVAQEMRQQAFNRINAAPLKRIDTTPHGDLVSRLVNDADAVAEGLLQGLSQLIPGVLTILTTLVMMLVLDVSIALVVIIITPLSILFARFVVRRTGRLFTKQSQAQGAMSAFVGEMVTNQNLLRTFGAEAVSEAEFDENNQQYFNANFKATVYSSIINPGTRFINAVVYAAAGTFGAVIAIGGGITVGGVSAFLAYANQYTKPFNEISAVTTQLQSAVAGAKRLFEVMDWEPEQPDAKNALAPTSCKGAVEAKAVNFAYNPGRPLIQNFTTAAKPGQRIALVGPTGCGKTTIINLLMRFYEVDSGIIKVDDNPITGIQRSALRSLYGMVLQETWLKWATVHENIAYGRPNATREQVVEAAKAAYAHSFIKRLPKGYNTIIETGGGNLSAGQKQLLCIARIMLAKPDMLILDEATSSIDTRTEMLIQKALEKLMQGHTSFIVAHRLSTIQHADIILMMNAGKIVEQGTHPQLLAQNGYYARLYNSQFSIEE